MLTNKLSAEEFERASKDWELPEKHNDTDEIQLFTIETDDPEALDEFLKLFGAHLLKCKGGTKFQQLADESFVIWTRTNGPYVHQMILSNETVGRNCRPLDLNEEEKE